MLFIFLYPRATKSETFELERFSLELHHLFRTVNFVWNYILKNLSLSYSLNVFAVLETSCRDDLTSCEDLKDRCYLGWVREGCRQSCGWCDRRQPTCVDRLRSCTTWKDMNFCWSPRPRIRGIMQKYCARSCGSQC